MLYGWKKHFLGWPEWGSRGSTENSRVEISVAHFRPRIENFRQKAALKMYCRSPWNFSPSQSKVPSVDKPRGFNKKGKFSISLENIWMNMIWTVPGYLITTTVPIPLSKNFRKRCIVRVNRQRCTTQGELLLHTVLTGQFARHSGQWVRLTTLLSSCTVVLKSGNFNFLVPSEPLYACKGTAFPFYIGVLWNNALCCDTN